MGKLKILLLHLKDEIRDQVARILWSCDQSYSVAHLPDGQSVWSYLQGTTIAAAVLGCRFESSGDGADLCRRIHDHYPDKDIGLLLLHTGPENGCEACALPLGGDLCVQTSPLDPHHFLRSLAKVVLLHPEKLLLGPVELNRRASSIHIRGREVHFSASEFALFWRLGKEPGQIVSRIDLRELGNGGSEEKADASLRVLLSRVRSKLGPDRGLVETVRGLGLLMNLKWRPC